jgi:hypothetical protein
LVWLACCLNPEYGQAPFSCKENPTCPEGYRCTLGRCVIEGIALDGSPMDRPADHREADRGTPPDQLLLDLGPARDTGKPDTSGCSGQKQTCGDCGSKQCVSGTWTACAPDPGFHPCKFPDGQSCESDAACRAKSAVPTCPCDSNVKNPNFCSDPAYMPKRANCPQTWPGGYCDPNGDGDFSDADWPKGDSEYHSKCPGS